MAAAALGPEVCPEKKPRLDAALFSAQTVNDAGRGAACAHTRTRRNTTSLDAEHHLRRPPAPGASDSDVKKRGGGVTR